MTDSTKLTIAVWLIAIIAFIYAFNSAAYYLRFGL